MDCRSTVASFETAGIEVAGHTTCPSSREGALGSDDEANLLLFVKSLDGRTPIFESDGDVFKDPTRNLP
jgi:hypothetical protein